MRKHPSAELTVILTLDLVEKRQDDDGKNIFLTYGLRDMTEPDVPATREHMLMAASIGLAREVVEAYGFEAFEASLLDSVRRDLRDALRKGIEALYASDRKA